MSDKLVLGLDIGTNSIGWALVSYQGESHDWRPAGLVASGVRVFQEAVDAKSREPKNKARRAARAMRRVLRRRRGRLKALQNLLVSTGLLDSPLIENREDRLNAIGDPYTLRARGLDEDLTREQFARVLMHLCKRRGFKSNRKGDRKDDDTGKVLIAIHELETAIADSGARTLGEYLSKQATQRNRRTNRTMYEHEFEVLWTRQRRAHPSLLTESAKLQFYRTIFWQRPIGSQSHLIGRCSFHPNRRRAARWSLPFQRFRMLQTVNALFVRNPKDGSMRPLAPSERNALLSRLEEQQKMTWGAVRKLLKLHSNERFNFEEVDEDGLLGNRTAAKIHAVLGERWTALAKDKQDELVVELNTIEDEGALLKRLVQGWGFDDEIAMKLGEASFEPGYASFSMKMLRRVLPHLEQGMIYDKALAAAGYDHAQLERPALKAALPEPPHIRNPIVHKALHQVRRLVNAIIKTYGRPHTIRIELAREAKTGRKERERQDKQKRENEKLNRLAHAEAINYGIANPSRTDLLKYRLWLESGQQCPYTGQPIPITALWSESVEIEHIIPYSRSLDDSYMNLTLCLTSENRNKGNRTPFEAYGGDSTRFEEILQRIQPRKGHSGLPWPKRRRFEQREVDALDGFVARHLNDTRYIAIEVRRFVEQVCERTEVSRGDMTAALRHQLGLNHMLSPDGEKNRADHRHHAVDALVIALLDPKIIRRIQSRYRRLNESLSPPWPHLMSDLREQLDRMIVSHAPSHKLAGALHEDTAYGYLPSKKIYVYRKALNPSFKAGWVEDIVDPMVRSLVQKHLDRYEGDSKKAFAEGFRLFHCDGATPITKVRIVASLKDEGVLAIQDSSGKPFKYYKKGNNHQMEVWELGESQKLQRRVVSTLSAATLAMKSRGTTTGPTPVGEARLLMKLHINDMLHHVSKGYFRVQKLSQGALCLRAHNAATIDFDSERLLVSGDSALRSLAPIQIDILGRISDG